MFISVLLWCCLSTPLLVERIKFFYAQLLALGQEVFIDFSDLVIGFLRCLVDEVLSARLSSFIFCINTLILVMQCGSISVNHKDCEKRPLEGIRQILEGDGTRLERRPVPPFEAKKSNE